MPLASVIASRLTSLWNERFVNTRAALLAVAVASSSTTSIGIAPASRIRCLPSSLIASTIRAPAAGFAASAPAPSSTTSGGTAPASRTKTRISSTSPLMMLRKKFAANSAAQLHGDKQLSSVTVRVTP
eukprot:4117696-Prymnesium_polylepis.1